MKITGMIDYARLREQTLGSGQDEEAVTVNTRALIDKVRNLAYLYAFDISIHADVCL